MTWGMFPMTSGSIPTTWGMFPTVWGTIPKGLLGIPMTLGTIPKGRFEGEKEWFTSVMGNLNEAL